jgi:predicted membrane-bound spermidine synthase
MPVNDQKLPRIPRYLLIVAFFEGGAVMAVELVGAKMIAPFYGNSLYVWTAVLATTLAGLAGGYFFGGYVSEKKNPERSLFVVLTIAAIITALMPFTATKVMTATLSMGLKSGTVTSSFVFLFPPLFCFGMISPLIVRCLSTKVEMVGRAAGNVYAISTVGGIVFTFITGFYLIPGAGLKTSTYLMAAIIAVFPAIYFLSRKKFGPPTAILCAFVIVNLFHGKALADKPSAERSYIKVIHRNDGVLGQVMVADDTIGASRSLFINNISQSFTDKRTGESKWKYVHRIATYASIKPEGSEVLLAGMGGGLLAQKLSALGFDLDVVDLDERMQQVSEEYFGRSGKMNVITDDIRHFLQVSNKQYDVIILDVSLGENQPSYVYTKESFASINKLLKENGLLFVHFPGILEGEAGLSVRSVGRTLAESGFTPKLIDTQPDVSTPSELIFIAAKKNIPDLTTARVPASSARYAFPLTGKIFIDTVTFSNGIVLSDDRPVMDILHKETLSHFRQEGIDIITKTLLKEGYTIF